MIYIASPYSDPDPSVRQTRFERVFRFTAALVEKGFVVFSPIVYLHPIALHIKSKHGVNHWWNFDVNMLRRSEALYLYMLPGWEESKGIDMEMRAANIMDLPIVRYYEDGKLASETWRGVVAEDLDV